ncbi:MAG: hypothetical protein AAFY34_03940 [Pseudomonadota bacterium]
MADHPTSPTSATQFNFDRLAAIFAIGVSFAAMGISLIEVTSVRAQQNASVWPYIEISERYSEDGFQLQLTNKGVGPALMGDIVLSLKGETVGDLDTTIAETVGPENAFSYDVYETSSPAGSVVASGEVYDLFRVPWEPRTSLFVDQIAGKVDISTCYCSIHEDCWVVKMSSPRPTKTEACDNAVRAN